MCNIIIYGFTVDGNLASSTSCDAYTSNIIGAQVQVQFDASEVGLTLIASSNLYKNNTKINSNPLVSQEYTVPYENAIAIFNIPFTGISMTSGVYNFGSYGVNINTPDFYSQYCYAETSKRCTTITLCTPNWQCEIPLNGYESDGCGNERQNTVCNPESLNHLECKNDICTRVSGAGTDTCIGEGTSCKTDNTLLYAGLAVAGIAVIYLATKKK